MTDWFSRARLGALGVAGILASAVPAALALRSLSEDPVSTPPPPRPAVTVEPVAAAPPPPPPAPSPPVVLRPIPAASDASQVGLQGPEILAMEERLASLKYLVGEVDGRFDAATRHGLTAFQKVEGLPRTGTADAETLGRLSTAQTPEPAYASPGNHIEIDIPRQVVFVVRAGMVSAVLPTSTGSGKRFTSQGWTRRAVTPNGQYDINRKIPGWRRSPLGVLYKPSYFNGGIALHGSPSVPTNPASHGCVRLPMAFADWFFDEISPIGSVVYVHGGPVGENPQPSAEDEPANPPPDPAPGPEPSPAPGILPNLPVLRGPSPSPTHS